jgi:hypothetical protein
MEDRVQLWGNSRSTGQGDIDSILRRLRELGYVEGRDFTAEYRWADGNSKLLTDFAAELLRLKVDLIVTRSTPAACGRRWTGLRVASKMRHVKYWLSPGLAGAAPENPAGSGRQRAASGRWHGTPGPRTGSIIASSAATPGRHQRQSA